MQAHHCCGCMAGGVAAHNAEPLWVQHWSNRKGWDRRKTLWGSWAVHSHAKPGLRFWFAGDTGSILRSKFKFHRTPCVSRVLKEVVHTGLLMVSRA